MEKVIHEVKVIETDDGYRIEIKGDKEKIKEYMQWFGAPGMWDRAGQHSRHWREGPFPRGWMHLPPRWPTWGQEGEEKDEGKEA